MFTLKFIRHRERLGVLCEQSVSCESYDMEREPETGRKVIIVRPSLMSESCPAFQLGEQDDEWNDCYVTNEVGKTIDHITFNKRWADLVANAK